MRSKPLLAVAVAAALMSACGLREVIDHQAATATPPSWRATLVDDSKPPRLTLVRHTATGDVEASTSCVRLVLADGVVHDLPFVAHEHAGGGLRVRCANLIADHTVTVTVMQAEGSMRVEVEDTVELPTNLAELSLEFTLAASGPTTASERFLPQETTDTDELAGDLTWRTPAAFARLGTLAIAVLPDVTTPRPRLLPGALEASVGPAQARIRHGLVAQRVVRAGQSLRCFRDRSLAHRVAGQTLSFAHEVCLWNDAQPLHTLTDLARTLWQRLAAPASARAFVALAPQVDRLLAARRFLTDDGTGTLPFTPRENITLLAAALATRADAQSRSDARRLVQIALSAPLRSGLSPDRALLIRGRATWSHGAAPGQDPKVASPIYDATGIAWTRVCCLEATRNLAPDDAVRRAAEQAALASARFLLANQLPNGAIPALYEAEYLAPVRQVLYEPAAETGAAALLLAECARLGTADADALRDGALAAIFYLQREVRPEHAWQDRATLSRGSRPGGRGTLGLIFAALASVQLDERVEHAGLHDAMVAFIDTLALQQQHWSPVWLAPDPGRSELIGGFGQHDGDPQWNDPVQALAALAFLRGYERLGRRDLLQRGAWALRAALTTASAVPDAELDARSPLSMAAAVAQIAFARWGNVIVDAAGGYVEALDAIQASLVGIASGNIALVARCPIDLVGSSKACFRGLPALSDRYTLSVNEGERKTFRVQELTAGVAITPLPVPMFIVAPPRSIQANQPFRPQIRFAAPPPPGFAGVVLLAAEGRGEMTSRLEPTTDPRTWRAVEALDPQNWQDAPGVVSTPLSPDSSLRERVKLTGPDGQSVIVNADAPIVVGSTTTIDIAGLDDTDLDAKACPRVLFADGARLARAVGDGASALVWHGRVPNSALAVELEILLAGSLRLRANDSVVHEDTGDVSPVARWVRLKMADRRLWEDSSLTLTFANAAPAQGQQLQVAELRTRVVADARAPHGDTPEPFEVGSRPDRKRTPDEQLAVLVLPVRLADEALTVSHDQLETLFFGDQYRRTPEPQARPTTGSVREVLRSVSGGRTNLVGQVAEPVATTCTASSLSGTAGANELAAIVTPALAAAGRRFDVIMLVHGGPGLGISAAHDALLAVPGAPPIALVAERAADLSMLPVGEALATLLNAHYGLARRSRPATGNFGALALTGHTNDHLPAAPIGIDLVTAGWADLVDVVANDGEITAVATQRERRVRRLASDLPGRGELILEVRGGLPDEPGLTDSGLLAYWRLADLPLVRSTRGDSVRPSVLRLSRGSGMTDSPFVPGSAGDLVRRADTLDDSSAPSLATPQGELCFLLQSVGPAAGGHDSEPGERIGFSVRRLTRSLLHATPRAQVRTDGSTWTELPLDGVQRGLGTIVATNQHLCFNVGREALRASYAAPSIGGRGQRLFFTALLEHGRARVRIGHATTPVLDTVLTRTGEPTGLTLELPPAAETVWLQVDNEDESGSALTFTDLTTVPCVRANHAPLRARKDRTARLSDGGFHAPLLPLTTGADSRAEIREPVLIPAQRCMLRLRCGFAADAPAAATVTLSVQLSSLDGKVTHRLLEGENVTRGEGAQPLLTALLAIPDIDQAFVGMLGIAIDAAPGTTLWIATAEVARP